MSTNARPKRKATINKTYDDSIELSKLEDISDSNGKKSQPQTKKKEPIKNGHDITTNGSNVVPYNWQPTPTPQDHFSNRLDLSGATINLKKMTLKCKYKNGKSLTLSKGQCIYMISEPPGEPYYIGRIRGFTNKRNHKYEEIGIDDKEDKMVPAEGYFFIVNWFYRPRDITKNSADSRLLYATMDSDVCPLSSFRGLVTVELKRDIEDSYIEKSRKQLSPGFTPIEAYAQSPNCFYFDKLYDRYMIRSYDVLSTQNLLQYAEKDSKSKNYLIALNKRFSYIFCESTRTKSLINSFKNDNSTCFTCGLWSDHNDSISCFECKKLFHMLCLDPPLLKKPSRGFSWTCASCTKKHEIEYHQKKILMLSHDNKSSNQDSLADELAALSSLEADVKNMDQSTDVETVLPKYEVMAKQFLVNDSKISLEDRRIKEEWCMRYLGLNAKLEEGVDLDDKSPYPRASTRIGAKHQAIYIPECNGHPIVYYDAEKVVKKKSKAKPKEKVEEIAKLEVPKEFEDFEVKDYPEWLQPRPKGYIERGVDDGEGTTCTLLWKTSPKDIDDNFEHMDKFIATCDVIAEGLGLSPNSPNFVDAVVLSYMKNTGDVDKAFDEVQKLTKKKLNEPVFNREEIKRFEAGVKEFGNELFHVQKRVKSQPLTQVVRFYYLWKKTKNGKQIWGNYEGRAPKKSHNTKEENNHKPHINDDITNPEDDSSYEEEKIKSKNTKFICKHCNSKYSTQWFKITNTHDANSESDSVVALCFRCAKLWRRYAVIWQDAEEVQKRSGKSNGWKKKIEPELLQDSSLILEHALSLGIAVTYDPKLVNQLSPAKPSPDKKESSKRKPTSSSPTESPTPKAKKVKTEVKVEKKEKVPKVQEIQTVTFRSIDEVVGSSLGQHTRSLLFNPNYETPKAYGLSKKLIKSEAPNELTTFMDHYREIQLGDVSAPLVNFQTPHLTSIELPFKPHERKCCICREHDTSKASLQEMLICSSCGVNVHASCAAYSLHEKESTKEWLCEPCINDLRPIHTAIYSCSLCMANETNYELSILGSPNVRPDFLKPTSEGSWCHLLCSVFNSEFIQVSKNKNVNNCTLSIENVSKIYLNNHNLKCEICQSNNGSLVKCDLCDEPCYYHPTCAQDTPNYKLGFKLVSGVKSSQLVKVNENVGLLKCIMICPKHDQTSNTILNFRTLGKRMSSKDSEPKPIIKLFLEDLLKTNKAQFSGPHARSLNYVKNCNLFYNNDQNSNVNITSNGHIKKCSICSTDSSPMWYESNICKSCHHKSQNSPSTEDGEEEPIKELLSAPLNGENYGIKDQNDKLKNVYKPNIIDESSLNVPVVEPIRSKISIVDILT